MRHVHGSFPVGSHRAKHLAGWLAGEYSEDKIRRECVDRFNVTGSGDWPVISLGGYGGFEHTSNIVFSNGEHAHLGLLELA